MKSSFEETVIEVWRHALVEDAAIAELDGSRYPFSRTPKPLMVKPPVSSSKRTWWALYLGRTKRTTRTNSTTAIRMRTPGDCPK